MKKDKSKIVTYKLKPCADCLKKEYEEGYQEGYEEGNLEREE